MKTDAGQKYRIRYGYQQPRGYLLPDKSEPKSTLITIQEGFYIYFGIARCNLRADRFVKKVGRELALSRSESALKSYFPNAIEKAPSFVLNSDGLSGYCSLKRVL